MSRVDLEENIKAKIKIGGGMYQRARVIYIPDIHILKKFILLTYLFNAQKQLNDVCKLSSPPFFKNDPLK